MKIHALGTGTVSVKESFLHARTGPRRQVDLMLPSPWTGALPIHCWAIEHADRLILVDTGETAAVRDIPFARFTVAPAQELPGALADAGLHIDAVDTVVLTHMHADHMDGAVHVRGPVLVDEAELAFTRTPRARVQQRIFHQPVPAGVDFQPIALDGGPFGAFSRSRPLTEDGRVVAVATPGHTVGHLSVVCVDDDGHHVLLAGDTTDTLEQLHARRADAVCPKPRVMVETIDTILDHGRQHPTVYLPSHDPDSAARLAARTILT